MAALGRKRPVAYRSGLLQIVSDFIVANYVLSEASEGVCVKLYLYLQHFEVGRPHRSACVKLYYSSTTQGP